MSDTVTCYQCGTVGYADDGMSWDSNAGEWACGILTPQDNDRCNAGIPKKIL